MKNCNVYNSGERVLVSPKLANQGAGFFASPLFRQGLQRLIDLQKLLQSSLPLVQQGLGVNQNQGVGFVLTDQVSGNDRFPECGGCGQNPGILGQQRRSRRLLLGAKYTIEFRSNRAPRLTLIGNAEGHTCVIKQLCERIFAAPRQSKIPAPLLGGAENSGFIKNGSPHRLRLIKLRVAKSRQPHDLISRLWGQPRLRQIHQVGFYDFQVLGEIHRSQQHKARLLPRLRFFFG